MHHYIGGPCAQRSCIALCPLHATHPDEIAAKSGIHILGTQGGTWVGGTPKAVAAASLADCERRRGEAPVPMSCPDEDGLNEMTAAALVKLATARQIAVGEDPEDKDSLIVAIRAAGPRPVIHVFWGDARWSRTQLLGELARGGWGMCRAAITDIFPADPGPQPDEPGGMAGGGDAGSGAAAGGGGADGGGGGGDGADGAADDGRAGRDGKDDAPGAEPAAEGERGGAAEPAAPPDAAAGVGGASPRGGSTGTPCVPFTDLWQAIISTEGRLLYAPRSEMTEERAPRNAPVSPLFRFVQRSACTHVLRV